MNRFTNRSVNRNIFCSLVTFIMAIFCAPCLSPSNNCKPLLLKQVWVLPWPTGAQSIFSSTFLLTGFLACNRRLGLCSTAVQHCKPDCAAFCLFTFSIHKCIWPQPAEYPFASLFLLLLPENRLWSGLGAVPSCVCWMVSTTLYLVPERVPACTQTLLECQSVVERRE